MNHTIIVAGGKGLRMGGDIPKQFIPVNGMPVLMHTIRRFREFDPQMHIVLVLPKDHQDYWRQLCGEYRFTDRHDIADGGSTRFHSSQNGIMALAEAPDTDIVAIHDGVRPLVSVETIGRCFTAAAESGAAIPVLPVIDTLRYVGHADENGVNTEQRSQRVALRLPRCADPTDLPSRPLAPRLHPALQRAFHRRRVCCGGSWREGDDG